MVAIETDNGRFEADTLKEAQRMERKAAREAAKRQAAIGRLQEMARTFAAASGFNILSRKISEKDFPPGWSFHPAGTPHTSTRQITGEFPGSLYLEIETENGRGTCDFFGCRFVGSFENGAGWTIAIALDNDGQTVRVYSVGVCEGEIGTQLLPNVTPDDFRQHGEKSEVYRERLAKAEGSET